jgi:hypothetical protein
MVQDRWLESFAGTRTRPAVARATSTTAAAAPAAPPLPSVVDRLAQRTAARPTTAISTMSDDQIVHSQLSGFALMVATVDRIDLPQIRAGKTVSAKVDVTSQLGFLQPAEADRLQSVMNEVDIQLKLTLNGIVLSSPRTAVTVDSRRSAAKPSRSPLMI